MLDFFLEVSNGDLSLGDDSLVVEFAGELLDVDGLSDLLEDLIFELLLIIKELFLGNDKIGLF